MNEEQQQVSGIVVNVAKTPVTFEIATSAGARPVKVRLGPGESTEIDPAYAYRQPGLARGTEPRNSVIENLTNGQVLPAEDPRAAAALESSSKGRKGG